jgi:hypothetical protein
MEASMSKLSPKARRDDLLIEELPTELLVYDQRCHRAHCLNASAAAVFQCADGTRTMADLASAAGERLQAPFTEDLTWLALQELDKNDLLDTRLPLVPEGASRRSVLAAGASAVLLPLVLAITAPTPAYAQSGLSGTTAAAPGGSTAGPVGPPGPTGSIGLTGLTGPIGGSTA